MQGTTKFLMTVFSSDVWQRASVKPLALPLREGGLKNLRDHLRRLTLEDVLGDEFTGSWSRDAWIFAAFTCCDSLYGACRPLLQGGWTKAEKRVVKAVGAAVDRLLCHGRDKFALDPRLEKELRAKRVSYSGEEISTCQKLTLSSSLAGIAPG